MQEGVPAAVSIGLLLRLGVLFTRGDLDRVANRVDWAAAVAA